MATLRLSGKGNIDDVSRMLTDGITSSGITNELIGSSERKVGDSKAILLVFEKYYMRSSNRASLSIMLTQDFDTVYVDAVGSGGGQGVLFRFSWGAEEDFVSLVSDILTGYGFS